MVVLPRVASTPWPAVVGTLTALPLGVLAGLTVVWAAGLATHTITLTAGLPGLNHRRAILLSLTGSAVANVLPLGGAAGIALNYRMIRRWGFDATGFASYTLVTNLWDVVAKLLLPAALVPVVLLGTRLPGAPGVLTTCVIAIALALVTGLVVLVLARPGAVRRVGGAVDRVLGRPVVANALERWRRAVRDVVAASWHRLTLGIVGYTALLFALLAACLHETGAGVPLAVVLLGFCVERLATLVGLTPGGLGVVEVGLVGALMLAPGASAGGGRRRGARLPGPDLRPRDPGRRPAPRRVDGLPPHRASGGGRVRILHVTDGYLPRLGGIELHVRDLAHHQRRAGIDAMVVTRTTAAADVPDPDHVLRVGRAPR